MEIKILKRQPMKLLALFLFWGVLASASLFFALQYWTDMRNLAYVKEYYACTGTLIGKETLEDGSGRDKGALLPIKKEAVELLSQSDAVSRLDIRATRSAYSPELRNISSVFYGWDAGHLVILEGTVESCIWDLHSDNVYGDMILKNPVIYSAHSEWKENIADRIIVNYTASPEKKVAFEQGDRLLVVCKMSRQYETGFTLYAVSVLQECGTSPSYQEELSVFDQELSSKAFTILKSDATVEEVQKTIRDKGFEPFVKDAEILDHVFTVHMVSDMKLLLPVTNNEMFYTAGRGITPEDAGKKVCVINNELAERYSLQVGDSISLGLADGCYETGDYLSGYPTLGRTLTMPYGDAQAYEIIGTYNFTDYHHIGDPFQYSYNGIFIPSPKDAPLATEEARPYTMSIQVPGEDYDRFLDIVVPQLGKLGYTVRLDNSKWLTVQSSYKTMEERRSGMLIAAVSTFLICCTMYTLLLGTSYKKEFALRKLLGTDSKRARRAYSVPFILATVLGSAASIGSVIVLYHKVMKAEIAKIAPGNVPNEITVLLFLLVVTLIQAALCYVLLRLWSRYTERSAIRKLLK